MTRPLMHEMRLNGMNRTKSGPIARVLSLLLAAAILALFIASPSLVMRGEILLTQAIMPVALLGIVGGIVYGMGWRPRSEVLAAMISPWAAWPIMLSSAAFLAFTANQ